MQKLTMKDFQSVRSVLKQAPADFECDACAGAVLAGRLAYHLLPRRGSKLIARLCSETCMNEFTENNKGG